jgi:hypothetical protein
MMPSKEDSTISIPVEFYGTEVEILMFPFYNKKTNQDKSSINDIFDKYLYSFGNFKFSRDEANNYE